MDALRRHRQAQAATRLSAPVWDDRDLVFANQVGGYLDPTDLTQRRFRAFLAAAGLPVIRFHDLRHSAATLMMQSGAHPKAVTELLGHASEGFTLQAYSHAVPSLQREAADRLGALFAAEDQADAPRTT